MCEQLGAFNAQGYVHLEDFLDKTNCAELTQELKKLVYSGVTTKDVQCPKSEAVHGAVVFDSLLEQLLPHFEKASGKNLLPTYAYARLYVPGECLAPHNDRAACEISATITLGFEGDAWPIFMADYAEDGFGETLIEHNGSKRSVTNISKISMQVGDAVLYRGMDKVHWRNEYTEGKWQAQVFLHYVDAEGPHADQKYDGRAKLAHQESTHEHHNFRYLEDALSFQSCVSIIKSAESQSEGEDGLVGDSSSGTLKKDVRDVKKIPLPVNRGIGATLTGIGLAANAETWQFDITKSNQVEFLKYDIDGHYLQHIDTYINKDEPECRKLTVLAFLNDDFEGGKFFILYGHERVYPPQKAGTVLVFPSFLLHGVEPVTKGIRRSIVTWLVGPWFK